MVKKEYYGVPRDFLEHHFLLSVLEASRGSNRKECVLRGVSTLITPVIDVMLLPCTLSSVLWNSYASRVHRNSTLMELSEFYM